MDLIDSQTCGVLSSNIFVAFDPHAPPTAVSAVWSLVGAGESWCRYLSWGNKSALTLKEGGAARNSLLQITSHGSESGGIPTVEVVEAVYCLRRGASLLGIPWSNAGLLDFKLPHLYGL